MTHNFEHFMSSEAISPTAMPPPQSTTMPSDFPSQLPRCRDYRRLSAKLSSTPSTSKRGSARISKLGSAGHSPHEIHRRKTLASHSGRHHSTALQDSLGLTKEQRLWSYYHSRNNVNDVRPYSWHPSTAPPKTSYQPLLTHERAVGNATNSLENLAVSGTPPASVHQSTHSVSTFNYIYPASSSAAWFTQDPQNNDGRFQPSAPTPPYYPPYPYLSYEGVGSTLDSYNQAYQLQDYSLTQWPEVSNTRLPSMSLPELATTTLPAQNQSDISLYLHNKDLPDLPSQGGEELVGIGLYDEAEEANVSTCRTTTTKVMPKRAPGKDLKLEETWYPPEVEDDDEDSSDGAQDTEDLPVDTPTTAQDTSAFYPSYGDLSNQSFFFPDDSEQLNADEQYTNYMVMDNELQSVGQVKTQPAGPGNVLWF